MDRCLTYTIAGIGHWEVKHSANTREKDAIIITNIYDNGDDTVDVELLLTENSDYIKDYAFAQNGRLDIECCIRRSGHSRMWSYQSMNSKTNRRDSKKYPSHCLKKMTEFIVPRPANTMNSTYTCTITLDKCYLLGDNWIGDVDEFRTKGSAHEALSNWDYVIYRTFFRYGSGEDGKKIFNSDEIKTYCIFEDAHVS